MDGRVVNYRLGQLVCIPGGNALSGRSKEYVLDIG